MRQYLVWLDCDGEFALIRLIMLKSGNLHSYWDSRIGTGETDRFLNQLTATIQAYDCMVEVKSLTPVLRVTLNRLPGTFRRHVSTGGHQTRPGRAGSASELKPSESKRDDRRRSLPALLICFHSAANQPSFPSLRGERERKAAEFSAAQT